MGHKKYYLKYGFVPYAASLGYLPPYSMPKENEVYWMVQPIGQLGYDIGIGTVECCNELNRPEYWRNEELDR